MAKVSVIVAAYNVEAYIEETMASVMGQTLGELEILAVDDCSTDETAARLERLAAQDGRIRVIRHAENSGAMAVRKTGVAAATGDYIMFLDGDDLLDPHACEHALHAIERERVELLQFDTAILTEESDGADETHTDRGAKARESTVEKRRVETPCGLLERKTLRTHLNFTVWNKIYRADLLHRVNAMIPNEYLNFAEDVLFSFLVQHEARSYAYLSETLCSFRLLTSKKNRLSLDDPQLSALLDTPKVYRFLEQWTRERNTRELCEGALLDVKEKVLDALVTALFERVSVTEREAFFERMRQACGDEDLILALASAIHLHGVAEDAIADFCAPQPMFATQKRTAKRIGTYYFRMYNGGIENVMSSLTDLWVKRGYEVVLFTDEAAHPDDYPIHPAVRRIKLPGIKTVNFESLAERVRVFREAVLESGIDLMVYHAWTSPFLLMDEMVLKNAGVALTVHTHNLFCCEAISSDGRYAYHQTALPRLYRLADSVVTLTDVDTAWWHAHGLRAIKTVNPVWLPLSVEQSPLTGHRMLTVCRISPEKQVLDAIKIAELVRKEIPDATLTVLGTGDYKEYVELVEDYVKDNELESFVDLAGFTSNVLPYYQSSDLLLSTARFEGFGLALMESKICGLPMVCYELPNLDITRENLGMAIIPQGDRRAAAAAIVAIFSNEDRKRAMAREARMSAERICGTDLGTLWDHIFTETVTPAQKALPLYQRTPLEIAANLASEFHSRGILDRSAQGGGIVQDYASEEQCRMLIQTLEEIGRSESYRLGLFLTAIPRRVVKFLKRKRKKARGNGKNEK
ncbi:MAG: glycosyltransferase [Ruminococcaceae bacterium]|nr:glycosyltransferase [Oscillospiraceae bacterium]